MARMPTMPAAGAKYLVGPPGDLHEQSGANHAHSPREFDLSPRLRIVDQRHRAYAESTITTITNGPTARSTGPRHPQRPKTTSPACTPNQLTPTSATGSEQEPPPDHVSMVTTCWRQRSLPVGPLLALGGGCGRSVRARVRECPQRRAGGRSGRLRGIRARRR